MNSKSVSEVLRYFGLPEQQPHYRKRFYFDIKRLNLIINYGTSQEEIDNDGKAIVSNTRIKNKLINNGTFKQECSICKITDWLGNPLTLHLDHIDGDRKNNNLSNYRLLCPNCHSQTSTYCNKNIKNRYIPPVNKNSLCIDCGAKRNVKKGKPGRCLVCFKKFQKLALNVNSS